MIYHTYRPSYLLMKVFTAKVPFSGVKASEVVMRITSGKRPERPKHPKFTNPLWTLTKRCWAGVVQDRPTIEEVIEVLMAQLSAFRLVFARLSAHPHKSPSQVTETLATPSEALPVVRTSSPTTDSRQPSVDGGGGAIPYEMDTPQPEPTPPPKDAAGGHSTHRVIHGVTGGITKRSPSRLVPDAGGAFPHFPLLIRS